MSKVFTRVMELDEGSLLVVDSLNLCFRWKHSKSLDFADDFINVVKSLQKSYKCSKVLLLSDMGSSTYRKNIYPEYKANRAEKYAQQTEKEAEEFRLFFEEFERTMLLAAEELPLLRFKGVEADDLAAYVVRKAKDYNIYNIWLISSDKDWDLLVNEGVSRFSYVTRKEVTHDNWNMHYDCTLDQYISIKCLMGDTGDNIKGIEGIGPKRASDLVRQYDNALDIYYMLPIPSKYKYIQALNDSGETILTNFLLMDLVTHCEEAIGEENCKIVDKTLKELFSNE
jgi:5'-3' exonuclease